MRYKMPKGLIALQGRVVLIGSDNIVLQQIGAAGGGGVEKSFQFVSLSTFTYYNGQIFTQVFGDEIVSAEYVALPTKHLLVTVKQDIDLVNDKYVVFANEDQRLNNNDDRGQYCNVSFEGVNSNQFKIFSTNHSDLSNDQSLTQPNLSIKIFKMEEII